MEQQLQQAVRFFKSERAYQQLFQDFRKKYESLGRIGGNVSVNNYSESSLEEIGKFFGQPGARIREKGQISLRDFELQIKNTKFHFVSLKPLLDAYFGETIMSKKEQQQIREAKLHHFLQEQQHRYPQIADWIAFLYEQKREGRWILQLAETEPSHFKQLLHILNRALCSLPKRAERLPLFSQRITGNPHAFDLQTDLGRMFIHLLAVQRAQLLQEPLQEIPTSTEAINDLLQEKQIFRDDLLNFVTCANVIAETDSGIHPVWEVAAKHRTVQIIPLRELIPLVRVYPATGETVWIVENSGVCAALLDEIPHAPLVCTNGQFTLATLMLIDLLAESGCRLFYAGDFDPEGLGMAQRLLERHPASIRLWQMDSSAYQKTKPSKSLSMERLEKLASIHHPALTDVAATMRKLGKAGYQEALIDHMGKDIQSGTKNSKSF